jgi:hypothetical protein
MDECLDGILQESIYKKDHRILDIKSYIELRRHTSGVKASFTIIELGLDIPDEVMAHPTIQEMFIAAGDLVALCNVSDTHEKILCVLT